MAGSFCTGLDPDDGFLIKETKAYCEGLNARILSNSTTNPHESGSDAADAWDAGVAVAAAAAGGQVSKANAPCCAISTGVVPILAQALQTEGGQPILTEGGTPITT